LTLVVLLATWATAQDDQLLMERNRERLNQAENPLEISGLDNGPDGYRSASPALLASDMAVARVDQDEARRRRLAMYENGATFASAIPRVDEKGRRVPSTRKKATAAAPKEEPSSSGSLLLPIAAVVLLGGLIALRRSPGA